MTEGEPLILGSALKRELEAWGEAAASRVESDDSPAGDPIPREEFELQRAAFRRAYLMREGEKAVREAVVSARARKLSWDKIGHAIGTTGEAARQRYAKETA